MVSPVAGLRPSRAARLRTTRMPRPPMRMRSPFLRCLVTKPTRSPSTASVCFFDISWDSERFAARCLSVTVACAPGFLAAMAGPPDCSKWPKTTSHVVGLDDSNCVCHDFLAKNVGFLVLVPNLLPKYGHFFTWKGGEGPKSTAAGGFLNARPARRRGLEGEGW